MQQSRRTRFPTQVNQLGGGELLSTMDNEMTITYKRLDKHQAAALLVDHHAG